MGLVALLIAVIITLLLLVFSHSTLSPFNSASEGNPKTIRDKAQDVVNTSNENSKKQQDQTYNKGCKKCGKVYQGNRSLEKIIAHFFKIIFHFFYFLNN